MGKYHYGLKNVHYYPASWNGMHLILGEGKPWAGAVNLVTSITSNTAFSSDDGWALTDVIPSEELELEVFALPDDFRTRFLNTKIDKDGNLIDGGYCRPKHFALAFEVAQNIKPQRYLYFHCTAIIPNLESSTVDKSKDLKKYKINIVAGSLPNIGRRKISSASTTQAAYDNWYTAPTVSQINNL